MEPQTCAIILLFLSKRGLALSRPLHNLLGRNVAASDQEAAATASFGDETFNQAMDDPATEYLMPCDMKRRACLSGLRGLLIEGTPSITAVGCTAQ